MKSSDSIDLLNRLLEIRTKIKDGSAKAAYPIALAAVVLFLALWAYEGRFPLIELLPRK